VALHLSRQVKLETKSALLDITRQVITKDMFYFIRKPTRGVWDIVEETTVGV
jgi:hypothetical protein